MSGETVDPRLSKYRLDRLLGSGGMGDVRLAHDVVLDRDVAIKFISPEHVSDPDARRRLIREAQAAASLDHPGICAVYEVNADPDKPPFIVMQYVEGETLAERLRHGPLEARDALVLAAHVADALAAAHRRGVVHRDLKPENVIITPSGRPKLLDFGIARLARPGDYGSGKTATSLTAEASIIGTPAYMSPEQIESRPIDGRSDLFSLGCLLFECLTGRPAFTGRSSIEIYAAVLHVDPPAPSRIREGLTEQHDQLCRQLLAKDARERFQTADEVVRAIRLLLPDTALPLTQPGPARASTAPRPFRRRTAVVGGAAAVLLLLTGAAGVWWWRSSAETSGGNESAWYSQGTEHLRNAAYHSARRALEEAIRVNPGSPLAYTRLAEGHLELDETNEAKDALLRVDRSRLSPDDQLRYDAVNALALGKPELAVTAYRELTTRHRSDAGAWLDLGRAQQKAGLPADARASFEQALKVNAEYAAAHLHIGILEAAAGRRDPALARFADAERLYRAASNTEGETEAVLRRGTYLAALNELEQSRAALDRAIALASGAQNRSQEIRAALGLSTVTAAEGRLSEAESEASAAVQRALRNGLDTVAADGLIDLAVVLMRKRNTEQADKQLDHAIDLSRRAPRTALRAKLQRASLMLQLDRPAEAMSIAQSMLPDLRAGGHRRWELNALAIASRAHESLGDYGRARDLALEMLTAADSLNDDTQRSVAHDNLAGQLAALGQFPEALRYRERSQAIHRRQKDNDRLAFDLQNGAELLIRLGRGDEAEAPLAELEKGAAAGIEVFATRARRVKLLRAWRSAFAEDANATARWAFEVVSVPGAPTDSTAVLSAAVLDYATARGARVPGRWKPPSGQSGLSVANTRELRYWQLAALSARGDHKAAIAGAIGALKEFASSLSNEDRWRIAAIGAGSARQMGDRSQAEALAAVASKSLEQLVEDWKSDAAAYLKRADLIRLRREAGLASGS